MVALLVRSITIASVVVMTLLRGCFDSSTDNSEIPAGAYCYTAFDSAGVEVVTGWLDFDFVDEENIEGTWELKPVGNPSNIGPQTGEGNLIGFIKASGIQMNLNPTWRDNNVVLFGEYSAEKFNGNWQWITFAGPSSGGTFKAVR